MYHDDAWAPLILTGATINTKAECGGCFFKREMVGKSVRNVVVVGVLLVVLVLGREVAAAERTQTLVSSPSRTRLVDVGTPTSYDAGREEGYPLLMILHGLGLVGEITAGRFQADEVRLVW